MSKVGGRSRFQIRVEGDNQSTSPLGCSGITINVPTIDSRQPYLATEILMSSLGCNAPYHHGPGDEIWGFRADGVFGKKTATCLLMEAVREQWPPYEPIVLNAVLLAPYNRLDLHVRVWSNSPAPGGPFGDPDWANTKQRKDQQGIPTYQFSIRVGILGELRDSSRRLFSPMQRLLGAFKWQYEFKRMVAVVVNKIWVLGVLLLIYFISTAVYASVKESALTKALQPTVDALRSNFTYLSESNVAPQSPLRLPRPYFLVYVGSRGLDCTKESDYSDHGRYLSAADIRTLILIQDDKLESQQYTVHNDAETGRTSGGSTTFHRYGYVLRAFDMMTHNLRAVGIIYDPPFEPEYVNEGPVHLYSGDIRRCADSMIDATTTACR